MLKLPSIAYRRARGDMVEVYKHLHNKYSTNEDLLKLATNRNRGNSLKLAKQQVRLNVRRYFFSTRVTAYWNSLPDSVVTAPSLNSFKNRLDKFWSEFKYDPVKSHIRTPYSYDTIASDDEEQPTGSTYSG